MGVEADQAYSNRQNPGYLTLRRPVAGSRLLSTLMPTFLAWTHL